MMSPVAESAQLIPICCALQKDTLHGKLNHILYTKKKIISVEWLGRQLIPLELAVEGALMGLLIARERSSPVFRRGFSFLRLPPTVCQFNKPRITAC
jgi:hypothetical protein